MKKPITLSKKYLKEILQDHFEYTIPTYGLNWHDAEKIGRVYLLLGKIEPSRRYFLYAANKEEEADARIATHSREPQYTRYSSHIHVGLLYYYATEQSKFLEVISMVKEDILNDFEPMSGKNSKRTHQLSALVLANLLLEQHDELVDVLDALRIINPNEVGMLKGIQRSAISEVIDAYKAGNPRGISIAIKRYRTILVSAEDDPVSTGWVNNYDVLKFLERFGNQKRGIHIARGAGLKESGARLD